ncbi:MAG: hypothetical protein IRY90_13345 [Actinomadura rubrobrunea]|nr:hypothetical protein [Actinomadura rubrobrunea]
MVSALSLTLAACGKTTTAYCVDRLSYTGIGSGSYKVVPDEYCERDYPVYSPDYGRYFWYYGAKRVSHGSYSSGGGTGGTYVTGGSRYKPSTGKIKTSSGKTLRGGFGGSGRSGG